MQTPPARCPPPLQRSRRHFLAGAASIAALELFPFQRARAARIPRFTSDPFSLGVASGYPTDNGFVLWTRLAPSPLEPGGGLPPVSIPVEWEIATDDRMRRVVQRGLTQATPEWAHSVHVEATGLRPGREYWYRFTVGEARSEIGRTHTAPARGDNAARMRLAVASCQQFEHGYFTAYRHMLADELDVIVHVGDYIYEASWGRDKVRNHLVNETYTLEDYRFQHALYKSDADLRAAHAAYPWLVTWDDHEVDNDYADSIPEDDGDPAKFLERRAAAYRAYYEHMPLPRAAMPTGASMRLYTQRSFGDLVSLCLLDQRQYRSPHACPRPGRRGANRVTDCAELTHAERTLLGKEQETWLRTQLTKDRAQWNLLAQGTVMCHVDEVPGPGERYWTDGWSGYPKARERLIETLSAHKVSNPVVLSGDIHSFIVSSINRRPDDPQSEPIASEFVTTSITSQPPSQQLLDDMRAANAHLLLATTQHRGYLRVDVSRKRLLAELVALDTVKEPTSKARVLNAFAIEDGKPGPLPA